MVCSACGYANQVGHRFCGMCGTPLPHHPLTAPGAHGTHTFTRFPVGNGRPAREDVGASTEQPNGTAPRPHSGSISAPPGIEQPQTREAVPSSAEMVPEVPFDEYVKSFRYVPPADPSETTMRGEAEVLKKETAAVAEAPAVVPVETSAAAEANPVSATEDVGERLGLEESAPEDGHQDRPRFLDFSEPVSVSPPKKPDAPEPVMAGMSILGLNAPPKADVAPPATPDASVASRETAWTWLAVAALLLVAALGVLEWRAQGNLSGNVPVEGIKAKLRNAWRSYIPPSKGTDVAKVDANKPAIPSEEQTKAQNPDVSASSDVPKAAMADKSGATPPTNGASLRPDIPETQPSTGQQKPASPPVGSAAIGSQPTTQNTVPPTVTRPQATAGTEAALANAKPKAPATVESDSDIPVRKGAPGAEEMAKARNASDAAAAAAWLSKASEKGNPDAPVRLADMYIKGDGVPRSCEQAVTLLKAASTKGNAAARARLAAMYDNGTCVQRDLVKAYRWLNLALAADPNSHWALQNRDSIWQEMTPEERATEPPPH